MFVTRLEESPLVSMVMSAVERPRREVLGLLYGVDERRVGGGYVVVAHAQPVQDVRSWPTRVEARSSESLERLNVAMDGLGKVGDYHSHVSYWNRHGRQPAAQTLSETDYRGMKADGGIGLLVVVRPAVRYSAWATASDGKSVRGTIVVGSGDGPSLYGLLFKSYHYDAQRNRLLLSPLDVDVKKLEKKFGKKRLAA